MAPAEGNKLRGNTGPDECWNCRSGKTAADGEAPPTSRVKNSRRDTLKKFRTLASALGKDPDELLADFAEGWIATLERAVDKELGNEP
jgi:hypothetical protein